MKVLFVCQRNNGHSQIAKAVYNKITDSNDADSAGTEVNKDGQLLKERAREPGSELGNVFAVMEELDVCDVPDFRRTQLKPENLQDYDKVVAIMNPSTIPSYLKDYRQVEVWDIDDPKTKDLNGVRQTRDMIKAKVTEMVGSS